MTKMNLLQNHNFDGSSGIISELTRISAESINQILKQNQSINGKINYVDDLHRLVVHTDPHLDEYFAELLFRACLPPFKRDIDFIEQSTYSEDNDQDLISLGPNSAGFGFGGNASGGAVFLALFDEHTKGVGRSERSCSEIVSKVHCKNLPFSIRVVLEEINRIDSSGGAHPQHLNNIIKTLHSVRFVFKSSSNRKDELRDFLSPVWKRAIVDASIAAVIHCTENRIDLLKVDDMKVNAVRSSFEHYCKVSPHKVDPYFVPAYTEIKKNLFNLKKTFDDSCFKDDRKPQSLIISRIAFACDNAWGGELSRLIMVHYWETLMQGQIIFMKLLDDIKRLNTSNENRITTSLGTIEKITVHDHSFQQMIKTKESESYVVNRHLQIYEISPVPSAFGVHKSFTFILNGKDFQGFGFILINDKFNGTKAIFKGNGIPDLTWRKIIEKIKSMEPDSWYEVGSSPNTTAAFILNGNKTHQYVAPSDFDIESFSAIVKSIT
jgi:hypothetical protein